MCLSENDSLNRIKYKNKKIVTNYIASSNSIASLVYTYRSVEEEVDYRWNRQQCYSRLDTYSPQVICHLELQKSQLTGLSSSQIMHQSMKSYT